MSNRTHLTLAVDWMTGIANLTVGPREVEESKVRIAAIASALAEEFPPGAFCRESLVAVAREIKFFPSFGEVCDRLSPWWKKHRPRPTAIGYDAPPPPPPRQCSEEEIAHVSRVAAETIAALRASDAGRFDERALARRKPARMTPEQLRAAYAAQGLADPRGLE